MDTLEGESQREFLDELTMPTDPMMQARLVMGG